MDLFTTVGIDLPRSERHDLVYLPSIEAPATAEQAEPDPLVGASRARPRLASEMRPKSSITGIVMVFPPARSIRTVEKLAQEFVTLRQWHGDSCRAVLLRRRFDPLAARLRRMGIPENSVQRELSCLEAAVARVVWMRDGCPSFGSGGGSAA